MWDHLGWFLERAVPVAEAAGVKLAIHPDDPPWSLFDLPRVVTSAAAFDRVCDLVDSPANGVTFCTGSLGADPAQAPDLPAAAARLAARGRLHFAHLRNVRQLGDGPGLYRDGPPRRRRRPGRRRSARWPRPGFDGPLRPDHGRQIWSERQGNARGDAVRPGYGLFDRALGATYLNGLWTAHTSTR